MTETLKPVVEAILAATTTDGKNQHYTLTPTSETSLEHLAESCHGCALQANRGQLIICTGFDGDTAQPNAIPDHARILTKVNKTLPSKDSSAPPVPATFEDAQTIASCQLIHVTDESRQIQGQTPATTIYDYHKITSGDTCHPYNGRNL